MQVTRLAVEHLICDFVLACLPEQSTALHFVSMEY